MPTELRGLLVDHGGVLTDPFAQSVDAWLRAEGVDPERLGRLLHRWSVGHPEPGVGHDLETGWTGLADLERRLAAELAREHPVEGGAGPPAAPSPAGDRPTGDGRPAADRRPPAAGMLARLPAGMRPERSMIEVVRTARSAGVRTGLLSNSWRPDDPPQWWGTAFDVVVTSGEVRLRKPDPAIYLLAADRLGLPPAQVVFVDDLVPNVRGAATVGMVGVRHVDVETTVGELEILLGLPLR